jgi:predicted dinucleotide-binding enzyme
MPYAGDDATAKARVAQLAADLGWAPLDVGPLSAAVDLEHLALLWIRLVRSGGHDPHLVWTARQWAG